MEDPRFLQSFLEGELNEPIERKQAVSEAFTSKDPRYDGRLFVGVSSTGIYCRPTCGARMPKFENCTFFHSAAEAEDCGYRPCKLCRPELAPGSNIVDCKTDAVIAQRAAAKIRAGFSDDRVLDSLSLDLGCSKGRLEEEFLSIYHISPLQYLNTCRRLLAKALLTDTEMPVPQVAKAAGFKSADGLRSAFKSFYRMTPTDLRKKGRKKAARKGSFVVRIGYRPPYKFSRLLDFYRLRALESVESIDEDSYSRAVRIDREGEEPACGWIRVSDDPSRNQLVLEISDSLVSVIPDVTTRVRSMFDADGDPASVSAALLPLKATCPDIDADGVRVPGCFDPFEIACRAVLGQQVSVKAANRLAARIADKFGPVVDTGKEGLGRAWPSSKEVLALDPIEDALGELGVIRTRSRVIREIACLVEEGELELVAGADAKEQMGRLLEIKGIGPWSANYIAMRAMGYPDAFLETDVGVAHALPGLDPKERVAHVEDCRPWRSYAVLALWNSLSE